MKNTLILSFKSYNNKTHELLLSLVEDTVYGMDIDFDTLNILPHQWVNNEGNIAYLIDKNGTVITIHFDTKNKSLKVKDVKAGFIK